MANFLKSCVSTKSDAKTTATLVIYGISGICGFVGSSNSLFQVFQGPITAYVSDKIKNVVIDSLPANSHPFAKIAAELVTAPMVATILGIQINSTEVVKAPLQVQNQPGQNASAAAKADTHLTLFPTWNGLATSFAIASINSTPVDSLLDLLNEKFDFGWEKDSILNLDAPNIDVSL